MQNKLKKFSYYFARTAHLPVTFDLVLNTWENSKFNYLVLKIHFKVHVPTHSLVYNKGQIIEGYFGTFLNSSLNLTVKCLKKTVLYKKILKKQTGTHLQYQRGLETSKPSCNNIEMNNQSHACTGRSRKQDDKSTPIY